VKILLLLLIVVVAVGVYFSVNDNKESNVEYSDKATEMLLVQDNAKGLVTAQLEEKDTEGNANNKLVIDENESTLIGRSRNEQVMQSELTKSGKVRLGEDIGGFFDPNAIAPEDESVQIVYDDAMQVSVSDALAPEAGTEMMPAGDGMPMHSESTEGAAAPEPMDDNN
jgi:hypothetical protein